jgi:hypothetical protein
MVMNVDILDYMGKIGEGVLTLISIGYEDEYYEGTFYYTKEMLALTVDEKLEEKLESVIEEWEGYNDLMLLLIKKVVPIDEIISRLDEVDFTPYLPKEDSDEQEIIYGEDIDDSDIISRSSLTQNLSISNNF